MSNVFAPFTLPLRREGDASIVDANGKTVLVIDPDRDLEDDQATAMADHVFSRVTFHSAAPGSVPIRGPGHCDYDADWIELVRQHERHRRHPDMTDFALANRVFMADRSDLDLIVWQTAAKERIRWLSIELAKALATRDEASAVAEA